VLPPLPVTASQLDVVTIRDVLAMLELRISLETESAALAAQRRTDEHLALMRRAIVAFDESIVNGRSAIDEDFQFHLQIALATQNKYFEDFYRQLGTSTIPRTKLNTAQLSTEFAPNYLHRTNREHEYIVDAIERRDGAPPVAPCACISPTAGNVCGEPAKLSTTVRNERSAS